MERYLLFTVKYFTIMHVIYGYLNRVVQFILQIIRVYEINEDK